MVRAGTSLHELGEALSCHELALPNLGDTNRQTIAGALSSGTHGTGRDLKILSDAMVGVRLVAGDGTLKTIECDQNSEMIQAARVSLGAMGLFTAIKLRLVPRFKLRLRQWCAHVDDCLNNLDSLIFNHRNFDFYWYPRRDETRLRTWDLEAKETDALPFAECVDDQTDWSANILPQHKDIDRKFEEMEYSVPLEAGPSCFQEVRQRIKLIHRKTVCWRVLYRTVAGDDAFLSHSYGRPTVTISLHQNASLPYWDFFRDIEKIFIAYGGRPHWGKKYAIEASRLAPLFPQWNRFCECRRQLDPRGVFLNKHLQELFDS